MKNNISRLIGLLLLLLAGVAAKAADNNRIYIQNVETNAGKTVTLPVWLNNTSDIIAFEFVLAMPDGAKLNTSNHAYTDRQSDHQLVVRSIGGNRYKVMGFSPTNTAIAGQSGKLLNLTMSAPSAWKAGDEKRVEMSDVVLSVKGGGNVVTGYDGCTVTVTETPHADIIVKNISLTGKSFMPGQTITVNWTVENIGNGEAVGGWAEQVTVIDEFGTSYSFDKTYEKTSLSVGGTTQNSAEFRIPATCGIEGQFKVKVELIGNKALNEPVAYQGNNALTTSGYVGEMGKVLTLTTPKKEVDEGAGQVECSVSRSGYRGVDETVMLSSSNTGRLTVPASVVIPAGAATAKFMATVVDDNLWNKNVDVEITARLKGYADASGTVSITDNETATLMITTDKENYVEGDKMAISIESTSANIEDVTLMIGISPSQRIACPASVVLPAGETKVVVEATVTDDKRVSVDYHATLTVSAANYTSGRCEVTVADNDVPRFELMLSPSTVSECDGPQCVVATLRRTDNVDKAVNVRVKASDPAGVLCSVSQVGFAAGVREQSFFLGVVDNAVVDGERDYQISAGVHFPDYGITAGEGEQGFAGALLKVWDDDGPTLKMSIDKANVKEGGTAVLTVTRNTSTDSPLTVSVTSDKPGRVTHPASVTIATGQTSAKMQVAVNKDDMDMDNHLVTFFANADGYTLGKTNMQIVNQTLPDISDVKLTAEKEELMAKTAIKVTASLRNSGVTELPAGAKVNIWFSYLQAYTKGGILLGTQTLDAPLAIGATRDVDLYVEMPNKLGVYYLYAQVDAPSNTQEINEHNNVSTACKVVLTAPFTVRTSVDKDEVKVGETVTISGKATGSNVVNAAVNIIYEWNGKVYKVSSVTADSKGEFAVQYVIPKTQPGNYRFGACYGKDDTAADEDMCSLCAYGWQVDNKMFVNKSIEVGQEYTGSVTITNNCPKPLTGVRVDCGELPEGVTLTWDVPSRIEGGESVKASFALTPKVQASEAVNLAVMLKSDQCNDMELSGRYAAYNPYPNLESEVSHISTSATKGRQKIYKLSIGNSGNGPTGAITLALPDFIKSLSGTTIKSLAYGETTTITLGITPADDAAVNVSVSGRIGINCANGNGIAIPYDINIVSEETGTLHVDVCDEFTYYTDGAPQVKGAEVEVRNYNTNEVAYSGTTNEKGYVEPILTEGYYRLKVSASGHETFSGTVCVDPGKTTFKTVNLAIVDDIKVKYEVVETEVEDVYEIVTTTTFETAVPKPQLRLATSGNIDGDALTEIGQSLVYSVVVTNEGLITAKNVNVSKPLVENALTGKYRNTADLKVEYLTDHVFDLRPKESAVVTYKVTRAAFTELDGCVAIIKGTFQYDCGTDIKQGNFSGGAMISQKCKPEDILAGFGGEDNSEDFELEEGEEGDDNDSDFKLEWPDEDKTYDETKSDNKPKEEIEDDEGIVIAKVKLQFNQRMTMTRQAFRGTLVVENGTDGQMKDIVLTLRETDPQGNVATSHEFQVSNETIEGFGGTLEGPWTLDAKKTGKATILYIPTKYAAPYEPVEYTFGGQLSFKDPATGMTRLRDLTEQTLTVKPSPNLNLTYFMQRDVLGDDPLTPEIEPMEEAEFSLIIDNVGYGEATNVNMVTQQPQIIDNEQGLLINFEFTRALLNGEDETLAMGGDIATPFGDIAPKSQSYAQWFMTSTLMGHFTDYNVEATHVTSYDNPDLSLLNEVTIHELIRSVDVPGKDGMKGFICNDEKDDNNLPDIIYLTDGTKEPVGLCDKVSMEQIDDTNYRLTLVPSTLGLYGWNYGSMRDPKNGKARITKIVRESDGMELSLRNVWTTHATMRDGKKPLYENLVHIADAVHAEMTSYIVTYEDRPSMELQVKRFSGIPGNSTVATEEVTDIKVEFNKPITESTFTTDDIELMIQGNKVACDKVVISKVDELTYNVNIANVERADGLYILTVQTATIDDADGYYGGEGRQCSWNEFTGKPVALKFALKRNGFGKLAENACTVTMSDGATVGSSYPFGTKLKLKAVPAYGYTFERWAINGTTLSTSDELEYQLTSAKEVELWLKPNNYNIAVSNANGGSVNIGPGRYEYLEEIELVATPADGYEFVGWYAKNVQPSNSKKLRAPEGATLLGKEMTLRYTVVGEAAIYPEFTKQQTVIDCTISSIRCGTLILPFDSDIPEGMSVYSCSGIGDENIVELVEETSIKANTPYIIAGTPGTYHFYGNRIIEEYVWTSDYLTGTFETMYVPKDAYVLQNQKEYGVGFYRVKDDNSVRITPYHCYFNALNGSGAKFFKMSFGYMTGISNVTGDTAKPVRVYNINGQMVRTAESIGKALRELPAGIYIINNRKYSINNK